MVRIVGLDCFINGLQMSEPDGDVPFRAIAAFVKRLLLDLTEPNSESEHVCSEDCRYYHDIIIGTKEMGGFENCVPRFGVHITVYYYIWLVLYRYIIINIL